MSTTMRLSCLSSVLSVVIVAGCAHTPDGPLATAVPPPEKPFADFQADQAACKQYAASQVQGQAEQVNHRAVAAGLLGTLLGAGLGAAGGSFSGSAGSGAAVGAAGAALLAGGFGAAGTADQQHLIQTQYDNAFTQCMYARGNDVPGFPPHQVAAAAPAPPPPQPAPAAAPHVPATSSSAPAPDPALVRSTQTELVRLGYLVESPDGVMGSSTRGAIQKYQQATGLPANGVPSADLLARMQASPSSPPATATAPSAPAPAQSAHWVAPTEN
jgi:hypothetical protein